AAQAQQDRAGFMGVTSRVAAGRVLRDESLKTITGQVPKESSVTDTALAVDRQLHAVRIRDNITEVTRAPVARIFAEFGLRFKIFRAAVVAILELVRIVEQ